MQVDRMGAPAGVEQMYLLSCNLWLLSRDAGHVLPDLLPFKKGFLGNDDDVMNRQPLVPITVIQDHCLLLTIHLFVCVSGPHTSINFLGKYVDLGVCLFRVP